MDRQHSDPRKTAAVAKRAIYEIYAPWGPPGSARLDVSQRVAILFDKKNVLQL